MGGTSPPNREIDKRNKNWLANKGEDFYPYRYTLKFLRDPYPSEVEKVLGCEFIRVPFPGKNQVVWGFGTYDDLEKFKKVYVNVK